MVAKGLDIENVTLIGVVSADLSLYVNDFRAHERTFGLITQVIGRSGRGDKTGRAVIQTFTPENNIITLAAKQDYPGFYSHEIELRKLVALPPFCDLISLTVVGPEEDRVLHGCNKIKSSLQYLFNGCTDVQILGPAPASVTKVNNRYRYKLTLKCQNNKTIRDTVAHVLREFLRDKENKNISAFADADPIE